MNKEIGFWEKQLIIKVKEYFELNELTDVMGTLASATADHHKFLLKSMEKDKDIEPATEVYRMSELMAFIASIYELNMQMKIKKIRKP